MKLRLALPILVASAALTAFFTWAGSSVASEEEAVLSAEVRSRNALAQTLRDPQMAAAAAAILKTIPRDEKTGITPPAAVSPVKSIPEAQPPAPLEDRFAHYPVISRHDSEPDADGKYRRIKVVRTLMKYPLIRIEEVRARDFSSGTESVLSRLAMVADHALVRIQDGRSLDELEGELRASGYRVRRQFGRGKMALIEFDGRDPASLTRALDQLGAAPGIVLAEPDYLNRIQ